MHGQQNMKKNKMCALIFSALLSKNFFILRRITLHIITHVRRCLCKVPVIFVTF